MADEQEPEVDPEENSDIENADETASKPGLIGRLLDPLLHIRQKPIAGGLTLAALLLSIAIPVGGGIWFFGSGDPPPTVDDALAKLAEGDLEQARQMAVLLMARRRVPYSDRAIAAYVIGAAILEDADKENNQHKRLKLNLLSTRYLFEAYDRGLPEHLRGAGLYKYGKSLYVSHQYAESQPILEETLESRFPDKLEVHRMLASAYLLDPEGDAEKARAHIQLYLQAPVLPTAQLHQGLLQNARTLLKKDDYQATRDALSQLPQGVVDQSSALMILGRSYLEEADALSKDLQPGDSERERFIQFRLYEAKQVFDKIQARDEVNSPVLRQAQYLAGVAYRKMDQSNAAAREQFSQVRRGYPGSFEAIAAQLNEAELMQITGEDEGAIKMLHAVVVEASFSEPYFNPWLDYADLRARLIGALQPYLQRKEFRTAVKYIQGLEPVITFAEVRKLRAEIHEQWGEYLLQQAEQLDPEKRQEKKERGFRHFRFAGMLYEEVAKDNFATAEYPDYLWRCAEDFYRARDFKQTSRILKQYLNQDLRERHADALVLQAECMMAVGAIDRAIANLATCYERYPRHAQSYRARLLAAQAQLDLGNSDAAQALLEFNLNQSSLTPKSAEWRDSLFLLGKLLYNKGKRIEAESRVAGVDRTFQNSRRKGLAVLKKSEFVFRDAIARLMEAVQRYPDAPQTVLARYRIAEAHRNAAKLPRKQLRTVVIRAKQNRLHQRVQKDLQAALRQYDFLMKSLGQLGEERPLEPMEFAILRNCHFARADALFDMRRYEEAIVAYSTATNRYLDEPAALEAFVQMASCYRALNRPTEAWGQLERAKFVLNRLPADVPFEATTRYNRDEWARFLDWISTI